MWRGVILASLFVVPALAGSDGAWTRCTADPDASAQQLVAACTQVIEAKSPDTLLMAYLSRAGAYEQLKDGEHALADYDRAVALDAKSARSLVLRGQFHGLRGEVDAAFADFDAALAREPANARAWNGRGAAYRDKGDLDHAIADFGRAIELDPDYITALANRGSVHLDRHDHDAAIADFTRALKVFPDEPAILNDRGLAWYGKRDYARALADFNRAIALDPKMGKAYSNRGIAYGVQGQLDRAEVEFSRAIALAPQWPEAWANRGRNYLSKHEYALAIADYDKAIALNPGKAEFYLQRCMTYTASGDAHRALADCDHAIALKSDDGEFFYRRAAARFRNLDIANALADLDQAVERTPAHAEARMLRVRLYLSSRKLRRELARSKLPAEQQEGTQMLVEAIAPLAESPELETRAAADIAIIVRSGPAVFNRDNPCDSDVDGAATLEKSVARCRASLPDGMDEHLVREFTATALLNGKHFDRAIEAFDLILSSEPRDALALWGRGVARKAKGDAKAAADDFVSARRIDPELAAKLTIPGEGFP